MAPQHRSAAVVSLAYEGGLADHRETVLPALDRLGLSATFLMPPEALLEAPLTWQEAHRRGFELGVHSLYGVTLDGALDNWNLEMVHGDLEMSCNLFEEMLDERPVVFSYPGSSTSCASGCYKPVVRDCYRYAISVDEGANSEETDPYSLKRIWTFNLSGPEIIRKVESGLSAGRWPIVVFEGIGTGMRGCDASAHLEVCLWLSKATDLARVLPVSNAAESFIRAKQVTVA